MRGEFVSVWSEMWRTVWKPLSRDRDAPHDLFCELYRELECIFNVRLEKATELAEIVDDVDRARIAFRATRSDALTGEWGLISFLERAHAVIGDVGTEHLTNKFFVLIEKFIERYSLRYDLRRPFSLHPTLPGIFARLVRELRQITSEDPDLAPMMRDFEDAVRDLRLDTSPARMKTCFMKQFNLLESLAGKHPDVKSKTLGRMCGELETWPHASVKEAAKKMYGFRAYPGVGHGSKGSGALREIEMRDLIAISILLAGLSPYLTDLVDPASIYQAGAGH